MAKSREVWGIDIGQSALKALRCSQGEDGTIIASSHDYIEYPKILSQPDADAEALVKDALEMFLERNDLQGDFVSMAVSGQAGLSRFFRPPPVDPKKLPDLVKYEVKQQIPFPIEDVIWDWQCLGGSEADDLIVDAEVGLFAIKRDTVFAALQPFTDSNIEVDLVQLSPLSVFNVICRDVLGEIPDVAQIDPENPPESLVVLSLGTDSTDLIVTNGIKLWLRNIPIGGNHFTKQLSRELKLTHAKAEHLKRNVRQMSENEEEARRVFQSMRPVFNDLVTEIQRSLTFYGGIEKNAKIERVVLLGNAARLPGLRQYLTKQLELDIVKMNSFDSLKGDTVNDKSFSDNLLSFTPCYGLCLQGLNQAIIETNLLPNEIVKERKIRAKKPWIVAAVAALLAGMTFGYLFNNLSWWRVNERFAENGHTWQEAFTQVAAKVGQSKDFIDTDKHQKSTLDRLNDISAELADSSQSPEAMAELMSCLYQVVPRDKSNEDNVVDPVEHPFDLRDEIYIDRVETQQFFDLSAWRGFTADKFDAQFERFESVDEAKQKSKAQPKKEDEFNLDTPGWIVELRAHHYHNNKEQRMASEHQMEFVRRTLLKNMLEGTVLLPGSKAKADGTFELEEFMLSDVGIYYPTVVDDNDPPLVESRIPNLYFGKDRRPEDEVSDDNSDSGNAADENAADQNATGDSRSQDTGVANEEEVDRDVEEFVLNRYDFVLQFAWKPTSRETRLENKIARLDAAMKLAEKEKAAEQLKANNRQNTNTGQPKK